MARLFGYLTVITVTVQLGLATLPSNFQSLDAAAKQELIWDENIKAVTPGQLPPAPESNIGSLISMLNPFYLTKAFTHEGDEMLPDRKKLIHPVGTVAKATLTIFPNSTYTGIFRGGKTHRAIVRASIGAVKADNFIPGIAIKVLIDKKPSANMFLLYSLDGQGENWNYFANSFATDLPKPTNPVLAALSKAFWLGLLALPGFSSQRPIDENNSPVYEHAALGETGTVKSPFAIHVIPKQGLGWDGKDTTDFRTKLAEIPAGTVLYTVAASDARGGSTKVIGELKLDSQFVASSYGDNTLYFQHPSKRIPGTSA